MALTRKEIAKRYKLRHPERVKKQIDNWKLKNPEKFKSIRRRVWIKHKLKNNIPDRQPKNPDYYVGFFKTAREYVRSLKNKPCMDCGFSFDPVCMDFDHVRGVKLLRVSQLVGCKRERILDEVSKCDVVCANCHRIRTYNRIKNSRS